MKPSEYDGRGHDPPYPTLADDNAMLVEENQKLRAENEKLKTERMAIRAKAWSEAADTVANNWNLLARTTAWHKMTPQLQAIWKDLKEISKRYWEAAEAAESGE